MQDVDLTIFPNTTQWRPRFNTTKNLWGIYSDKEQRWKKNYFTGKADAKKWLYDYLFMLSAKGDNNITKANKKKEAQEKVELNKEIKAKNETANNKYRVPDDVLAEVEPELMKPSWFKRR